LATPFNRIFSGTGTLRRLNEPYFLLREVFDYNYDEIAQMVGKAQLPSDFAAIASAYRGSTPRFPVSHQQQKHSPIPAGFDSR